jgi:hypothetical protein
MNALQTLAQAAGIAYAVGLNLYATVGVIGLATRLGWIEALPSSLSGLSSWWVIGIALVLMTVEFLASLIPTVASIWDTLHSLIRPPAAALLAAATAWHGDPAFVLVAALLGGSLAVTTHTTKLGLRYAIDASPEPISNAVTSIAELGLVTTIALTVWQYPFLTLTFALFLLVLLIVMVRLIWRTLCQVFAGQWVPRHGFLQDARTSDRLGRREDN